MTRIVSVGVHDVRFPTAAAGDGSDAINRGDYSTTYVELATDGPHTGAGFTFTNGRAARRLLRWMASATSSLPVPLSPVTSTVRSFPWRRWICSATRCIAALAHTNPGAPTMWQPG